MTQPAGAFGRGHACPGDASVGLSPDYLAWLHLFHLGTTLTHLPGFGVAVTLFLAGSGPRGREGGAAAAQAGSGQAGQRDCARPRTAELRHGGASPHRHTGTEKTHVSSPANLKALTKK